MPYLARSFGIVIALLAAADAGAATYTIASLADGVAPDGSCTLREALRAAETHLAVNECPAGDEDNLIVLQAIGTYPFGLGEEPLTNGVLAIRGATLSPANHVVDMQGANRFLDVQPAIDASLFLDGVTLRNGSSLDEPPFEGGALRLDGVDLVEIRDVVIETSIGTRGGGVYLRLTPTGQASLEGVVLRGNVALGTASDPSPRGGGAYLLLAGDATLSLSSVTIEGNEAYTAEPAANVFAGGAFIDSGAPSTATIELRRLTVRNNQARGGAEGNGGGLLLQARDQSRLRLADSSFDDNRLLVSSAFTAGGAGLGTFALDAAAIELRRLRIARSDSPDSPAGQLVAVGFGTSSTLLESLSIEDSPKTGVFLFSQQSASMRLGQLTVTGNRTRGVLTNSTSSASPRIENSVLWGNGPPGTTPSDLTSVNLPIDADRVTNHNWIGDQGDPNPLFVDPAMGDFSLQAASGAVDAGDATFASVGPFDLRHAPRVVGGAIDLGALERGGLFADDFESGATAAWSASIP